MPIDNRIIKVSIEINGQIKTYEDIKLEASGEKYANQNQDTCEVKITNVDKETMNYILTETSPFNKNKTPKSIKIEAGRVSYGVSTIYEGNIVSSFSSREKSGSNDEKSKGISYISRTDGDITLNIKCLTQNFQKGNIVSKSEEPNTPLSTICKNVSDSVGVILDFQATDTEISDYSFTGSSIKQVNKLNQLSLINAFIDGNVLHVKDINKPLNNIETIVNLNTGMIGIPEVTEQGIKITMLLDNKTKIGGLMKVNSEIYPQVNGEYIIYKLGFHITNRDTPFYWIAEGKIYGN